MVEETEVCKTSVWQNIFYVDNLVKHGENGKNYCLDVGWYISNEFMFYIFNIIAIYVYLKKPVLGWISALSILVISLGVTFSVASANSFKFNWPSEGFNQPYYFENFYIKPFTRMIPYAMGTILGFLYS
jgi:peptidoglycan/LPS O-acetylase OafA/YrhL